MANTIRIPVPDVAYAPVKLPAININDNPYEAVEDLAVGIGNALAKRKALEDEAFLREAEADFYDSDADHGRQRSLNGTAAPDGSERPDASTTDAGHTQIRNDALEARFEFWASKRPDLRNELRRSFAKMRVATMPLEISREATARAANAIDVAGATMKELAGIAYLRPADIGAVRAEARNLRTALPEGFAQMFDTRDREINEAYLRGLIRTNPKHALEALKSREDLRLAEPLREALQHEAERAYKAERDAETAALEHEQIALRLDVDTKLTEAERAGTFPRAAYTTVRDAYKLDPAMGQDLEAKLDAAHAHALTRIERDNKVGRALVEGLALTWEAHRLESLDRHIEAVANGADDEATANHRRVRMAIIAGTTPPKLQRHIREGLRATDPVRRAASIHMLEALERADETLYSWLPTDLRTFAHHFTALTNAGYAEAAALQHLDAAKSVAPEKASTRRHHFDTHLRIDDLASAVARTFNVAPTGIAEDEVQTLEYRADRDPDEPRRGPIAATPATAPRSDWAPFGSDSRSEDLTSGQRLKQSDTQERLGDYNAGKVADTVNDAVAGASGWDTAFGRAGMQVKGKGRYVWTRYGWVDLQHVISAATATNDPALNVLLGIATEGVQTLVPDYWPSAWKKEDLLSNWIGAQGLARQRLVGGNIGDAVAFVLLRYDPLTKREAEKFLAAGGKAERWHDVVG